MTTQNEFYGVDRQQIKAIMQRARRERNEAIHKFFARLFKRTASQNDAVQDVNSPAPAAR